jgi:hypothetical protein
LKVAVQGPVFMAHPLHITITIIIIICHPGLVQQAK